MQLWFVLAVIGIVVLLFRRSGVARKNKIVLLLGPPSSSKTLLLSKIQVEYKATLDGFTLNDVGVKKNETTPAILEALGKRLKSIEHNPNLQGFVLKGFPKNAEQAKQLDDLLNEHKMNVGRAIVMNIDDSTILQEDDFDVDLESLKVKLGKYRNDIAELEKYYEERNLLTRFDGNKKSTEHRLNELKTVISAL